MSERNPDSGHNLATYDEVPRPKIVTRCKVCRVMAKDVNAGLVLVSPTGRAHHGEDYGMTSCGRDATGDRWWWPL